MPKVLKVRPSSRKATEQQRPIKSTTRTHTLSPEVHVPIQPVANDVGAGPSGAAAHDDDDDGLHGLHLEGQRQGEGGEGHDAELAEEADGDAPGLFDVSPQLGGVHRAAHGEHHHGQHDGEHRAQHRAQDGIEIAGGHQAVGARADGGVKLATGGNRGGHSGRGGWRTRGRR